MEKTWKEKNQERQAFWSNHLEQWSASGLTQREYCRQNNLISHRFTYWKIKLNGTHLPVKFVQVVPAPVQSESTDLKLNIGPGLQIEIPDGFSQVTFERVLVALRVL